MRSPHKKIWKQKKPTPTTSQWKTNEECSSTLGSCRQNPSPPLGRFRGRLVQPHHATDDSCPIVTIDKNWQKHYETLDSKNSYGFPGRTRAHGISTLGNNRGAALTSCTIRWRVCRASSYTHLSMADHTEIPTPHVEG